MNLRLFSQRLLLLGACGLLAGLAEAASGRDEGRTPSASPPESWFDLAPPVAPPRHTPAPRPPRAYRTESGFVLENTAMQARFATDGGLRLVSLLNRYSGRNLLVAPGETRLFLTETQGRIWGADEWSVAAVELPAPDVVRVTLKLAEAGLQAQLRLAIAAADLQLGLEITNVAAGERSWGTAFPHLGGLEVSPGGEDDHYLFPWYGGLLHRADAQLRSLYGDQSAWWQMIDLFSPQEGSGLMVRCLDATGLYKGVAFRKGGERGSAASHVQPSRLPETQFWSYSLAPGKGSAMAFEYPRYTRLPGGARQYPDAALAVHARDWREAMRVYAEWARAVWSWRPAATPLNDVWQIQVLTIRRPDRYGKPLFDGRWYDDFARDGFDMSEFIAWWDWADRGPFGLDLERAEEEAGSAFFRRFQPDLTQINPATGRRAYPYNRGDYAYNESWGGLPALRRAIARAHEGGQRVQFYTDPSLVDDNTEMARQHARRFGVMVANAPRPPLPRAPQEGYLIGYGQWRMCVDVEAYQDIVAAQIQRIVRDTQVDAIRLDETGTGGYPCINPAHTHLYAEPGHIGRMQASERLVRRIREATEREKPDLVLMSEYPGYDFLASQMEGALVYETAKNTLADLRPLPVNFFRFFFPGIKLYDYPNQREEGQAGNRSAEWSFWNANGRFRVPYPPRYHRVLRENADALHAGTAEPLVPTRHPGVYANRFTGSQKEVTLLLNDRAETARGAVLAAVATEGWHYWELLQGRELPVEEGALHLELPAGAVAAIARWPRLLQVQPTEDGWQLRLAREVPDAEVALCDAAGEPLERRSLAAGGVRWKRSEASGRGAYFKLYQGKYLVDAAGLP